MVKEALPIEPEFSELGLAEPLLQGISQAGFRRCTPIQAKTLPLALAGRDVAGQAQTGTGKTAAFLLATLHRLLTIPSPPDRQLNQPRALILAPTRELAIQIHKDAQILTQFTELNLGLVYGGTGYDQQRQELGQGVDVLIGTPGRIIDYYQQKIFDLRRIQVVVLDEADRMLDLGFIKDVRFLMRRLPPAEQRLSLLFSATLSYRVVELAYEHMNNPATVIIEQITRAATGIRQRLYHVANDEKIPALLGIFREIKDGRVMVFINTKRDGERVHDYLNANGIHAAWISGDVPQKKRQQLLKEFHDGQIAVLVATDVAARGLHIPDVTHVINFDLPQDAEDYVHRIGRTARAGATGDAISLCCERYCYALPEIEQYLGSKIPVESLPADLPTEINRPAYRPAKPRDDRRPSTPNRSRRPQQRRN